ncbi:uncharacterized protein LOC100162547 precursor [Acyrthosiphon pisum]|uniref:ACYPI003695 protein n=1 Tax=Acyrthosiphon pisum TaxID=7029 RepID=C4WTM5_ACYPI|nr:uncharacterized protein LOC100162547 precursor [Acyrthosiphon pisum]BAH71245.1 ACYPI003695 [Acyrthosiphon pisum]|eukprot:NP_001280471.1 uncharacterized protein LOC100162547 precursor [Acyrthosiphon pisum]
MSTIFVMLSVIGFITCVNGGNNKNATSDMPVTDRYTLAECKEVMSNAKLGELMQINDSTFWSDAKEWRDQAVTYNTNGYDNEHEIVKSFMDAYKKNRHLTPSDYCSFNFKIQLPNENKKKV